MDRVLEKHNLPKLNQEETENINRSVTNMEIKSVIKHLSANRSLGPDVLTGKFYQKLREQLTPKTYPIQTLPENSRGRKTPRLILWCHHHPDTKTRQRCHKKQNQKKKKENYRPISLMNIGAKSLTKFYQTESNNTLKRSYIMIKWDSSQGCKDSSIYLYQSM